VNRKATSTGLATTCNNDNNDTSNSTNEADVRTVSTLACLVCNNVLCMAYVCLQLLITE